MYSTLLSFICFSSACLSPQPGAQYPMYGSMMHPPHHQPMNLSRAQSEEFIPPFPPMWQDPHTPANFHVPGGHNPPPPFTSATSI